MDLQEQQQLRQVQGQWHESLGSSGGLAAVGPSSGRVHVGHICTVMSIGALRPQIVQHALPPNFWWLRLNSMTDQMWPMAMGCTFETSELYNASFPLL